MLASGGTLVALNATGALDRPAAVATTPTTTTVGANNQPVTIDESSATINVAAKASPAVVRITVSGSVDTVERDHPRDRASARASSTTPAAGS